jgi:hypothetical protein
MRPAIDRAAFYAARDSRFGVRIREPGVSDPASARAARPARLTGVAHASVSGVHVGVISGA